jgi:hypothetical protein
MHFGVEASREPKLEAPEKTSEKGKVERISWHSFCYHADQLQNANEPRTPILPLLVTESLISTDTGRKTGNLTAFSRTSRLVTSGLRRASGAGPVDPGNKVSIGPPCLVV